MPRKADELGPLAVSRLREPGLHVVGGVAGLGLQVLPSGGRTWILRATVGSKRREMGLGGYPDVTLAKAREAARGARDQIRRGIDPIEAARVARHSLKASTAATITFRAAAEAYMAAHEASWKNPKHRAQWAATLESYAYGVIGDLGVDEITLPHILQILEPIWTSKTETASRLRGRLEMVLDWATAREYRAGLNPARWRGHLDKLLAKPSKVAKVTHHKALPIDDMPGFMIRLSGVSGAGARALEFAILTAARSGEVRGATWDEIDLDAGLWVVAAERMKAGREHRVPLSAAALSLLRKAPGAAGQDPVFSAVQGGPLSDMTVSAVLRRMKVNAVPHGFRSTFRDWVSERTSHPHEAAEMALAHTVGNKVEAAYRRGDMVAKRLRLMEDWATFCGRAKDTV
ncbi:tyrosine-type recombinase/integrase [Brevundimonas sp.]|uniref:tyrosine-type recombinase/integrase n=1 Tax=Brevundimonas TaxID=41275 RepID=UPI002899A21C|nr:integrase arm-type DNA-binding domain-containing protein [Brevundimonas sp.]